MDITLLIVLVIILALATWALWRMHDQVTDLRLDVQEIHCTLIDIALSDEDTTEGLRVGEWEIVERNGVEHG